MIDSYIVATKPNPDHHNSIRIYHECVGWIEKSVTRITNWYQETSFVDHLCYFSLVLLCFHACLFVDACGQLLGKG